MRGLRGKYMDEEEKKTDGDSGISGENPVKKKGSFFRKKGGQKRPKGGLTAVFA